MTKFSFFPYRKITIFLAGLIFVLLSLSCNVSIGCEYSRSKDVLSPEINIHNSAVRSSFLMKSTNFPNAAVQERDGSSVLNSQAEHPFAEFEVPKNYTEILEQTARIFLPYENVLMAVNILMKHDNIKKIEKVKIDLQSGMTKAAIDKETLILSFSSLEDLSTIDVLRTFQRDLGWNISDAVKSILYGFPYVLLDSNEYDAINIVLHRRFAGMGDLVFVANTGQVLKTIFPHKPVRIIFHSNEDFQLVCKAKLLKGLNSTLERQTVEGMEIINAEAYGSKHFQIPAATPWQDHSAWETAQESIIGKNDVSIVYALGHTEKEVAQNSGLFKRYGGKVKTHILVHELGFQSPYQNPLNTGDAHLGFGTEEIGLPPVSPVSKYIYQQKYPRVNKKIRQERKRIIQKFPGWEILDTMLGQEQLSRTIASEWGFLYAHEALSAEHYFKTFEHSRTLNPGFAQTDTTFFLMCGRGNVPLHKKVRELAAANDYNLFEYAEGSRQLVCQRQSKTNNVTIIMDYTVPRKLFNELFLYSDDLPTLVSGQDNLANVIYMNHLSPSGRPFFWETLNFQMLAPLDMGIFLSHIGADAESKQLRKLWEKPQVSDEQAAMFSAPRTYRRFFKRVCDLLQKHNSFAPQIYYTMLSQIKYSSQAAKYGETLIEQLTQTPPRPFIQQHPQEELAVLEQAI
ncbi:MAG: hypothetical protein ABII88_02995 [Candidatus Omnitrophota bacterium]